MELAAIALHGSDSMSSLCKEAEFLTILFHSIHKAVHIWDCKCKVAKATPCNKSKFKKHYLLSI